MNIKITATGDWAKALAALGAAPRDINEALKVAIDQEAQFLAGEIKKKIRSGPFQALSPLTIAARKLNGFEGGKPLNVTGEMKAAVTTYPAGPGLEKFVGVLKTTRAKTKFRGAGGGGRYLANIGQIMEEGRTILIKITPKMLRFLHGVLLKGMPKQGFQSKNATGIIVVHIPARPFIAPVFEHFGPSAEGRVYERLAKALGGKLGKP